MQCQLGNVNAWQYCFYDFADPLFSLIISQPSVPSTNAGIVQCLSRLLQLIDLEIDCRYGTFPCISSFKGLQRLSVSGISSGCDGLSTLVANSPGLSHLNIEG